MINEQKKISLFSRNDIYIVVSFFGFVLGILLFTFFAPNYYKHNEPVKVDIKKGASLTEIIDTLYAKKIIPSKANMRIAAFLSGVDNKIKAGTYNIPNGISYFQLLDLLVYGSPELQILVTIPEGIWQSEVAQILQTKLNIDSSVVIQLSKSRTFLNSLGIDSDNLEGYLLPETYYFFANETVAGILRRMKEEQDKIFSVQVLHRMSELKMTKKEILTLASIIDGESNLVSEFKRISGVYHNRLKIGMLLQADPTVQYLIREKRSNKIYYKDLEIDSKFNTYKYAGLPPAPINNPGKDAIIAALYPEKHNYLYFVADGNGGHNFSKTISEHEQYVIQYRQWRKNKN